MWMHFVSGRKNGLKISTLHQFVMAGLFVDSVLLYYCTGRVFWPEIFKGETAFTKFDFPATKERQGLPQKNSPAKKLSRANVKAKKRAKIAIISVS